jgi:RNA polymerase sigma factor (TIGR02999 family)
LTAEITQLLIAHGAGDSGALDRLVPLVYDDLRRLARVQLRRRGGVETLNTGGLVNEAYLRLVDQSRATWRDRGHFFAVCAIAMRQIVVDHARRRARQKRGGEQAMVPLDEARDAAAVDAARVLEIDLALRKLAETDRRGRRMPVLCRIDRRRNGAGARPVGADRAARVVQGPRLASPRALRRRRGVV